MRTHNIQFVAILTSTYNIQFHDKIRKFIQYFNSFLELSEEIRRDSKTSSN